MTEIELKSGKKWPLNTAYCGDNMEFLSQLPDNCLDSIVTDGPYGLKFMGKKWDYDVPSVKFWKECLRVLKPGGHILSFSSTRTYHRMAVNVEDAGFEIRDMISWVYGSGFPKSQNISKMIDKMAEVNSKAVVDKIECGKWIKKTREELGLSIKDVSSHFPSKTGGLTGCVSNWECGKIPTWEHFSKLKKILNLDDLFDYLIEDRPKEWIEAEREIIGKTNNGKGKDSNSGIYQMNNGNSSMKKEIDITISSTEEAKQWDGWGSALKPAVEPIVLARKPLSEKTLAQNVLKWGTGGINIDRCRVTTLENTGRPQGADIRGGSFVGSRRKSELVTETHPNGRFPANFIHDGSEEVVNNFPENAGASAPVTGKEKSIASKGEITGKRDRVEGVFHNDYGSASRFFYVAKPSPEERGKENKHPTVKPIALMRYLIRLVTPTGGTTGDFFLGSFTAAIAAYKENINWIGAERPEKDHGSFDMGNKRYQDMTQQILMDFS